MSYVLFDDVLMNLGFSTYCHRVLHVGHGRGELAEVQLRAVDERVSEISTAAAGTHTGNLPLLAVSHHSSVVLSCGDALEATNTAEVGEAENTNWRTEFFIVGADKNLSL